MVAGHWRFGRFELQAAERRLLANGSPVALGARAFDLLVLLCERAGHLVTKDEILDRVWPGLVVEENNIAAQVVALRKVLGGSPIATVPGHGYRFTAQPVPVPPPGAAPADRPPAEPDHPLYGRQEDLRRARAALQPPGCVTLTGPAGVGKTALARVLAAQWPQAVVWVDLAALPGHDPLLPALARALGQPSGDGATAEGLAQALRPDDLLVLDNAEHVQAAASALVAALLARQPLAHLLVTSQAPLDLPAQRLLPLSPLGVPGPEVPAPQALAEGAVGLLAARVRSSSPRLDVGAGQLPVLRELCLRLDGLPLALEMAAARVPLLGLRGVCDALNERFALLRRQGAAGDRHGSLLAALDWSHGLLDDDERQLFRRLGVMAGGFTADLVVAVEGVGEADRWPVVDRLARLVERHLVVSEPGEPPRLRLLESVRRFALDRLDESPDADGVRRRLAATLAAWVARALQARLSPGPGDDEAVADDLMSRAAAELDNVRETLHWARRHDPATAIRLSMDAAELVVFTNWRDEAFQWMQDCEPLLPQQPLPVRARWTLAWARQLLFRLDPRATAVAGQACELARAWGDPAARVRAEVARVRSIHQAGPALDAAHAGLVDALQSTPQPDTDLQLMAAGAQAHVHRLSDRPDDALAEQQHEVTLARALGRRTAAAAAESRLIAQLTLLGRHEQVVERARAVLRRPGTVADANAAYVHCYLLHSLTQLGRLAEASAAAPEALEVARAGGVLYVFLCLAPLLVHRGQPRAAALLLGHARRAYARRREVPHPTLWHDAEAPAAAALGDATLQRLMTRGEALDDAAVDALLRDGPDAA